MRISLQPGRNGLPMVVLQSNDGARAEVYLHGAHVTSWIPAGGSERLFLSSTSDFYDNAAMRGGVPVCFPQFSGFGPLPKHGFARTQTWELGQVRRGARTSAKFMLRDSAESRALWPHPFTAEYTVSVGDNELRLRLAVRNTGAEPLSFTVALHSYLAVGDIARTAIKGLEGVRYLDTTGVPSEKVQGNEPVRFAGEVDSVYYDAPAIVRVIADGGPVVTVRKSGFTDVVVWNPGATRAPALADLEPEGFRRFVCVEAVNLGHPITLSPGARWVGEQVFAA